MPHVHYIGVDPQVHYELRIGVDAKLHHELRAEVALERIAITVFEFILEFIVKFALKLMLSSAAS